MLSALSVRFRLSAAIAVLFGLILLVSLIGMRVLNRTETWMNVLHQETLAEVSDALDLSRSAADLATSAPFLYALFPPFQLEQEAQKVRDTLSRIQGRLRHADVRRRRRLLGFFPLGGLPLLLLGRVVASEPHEIDVRRRLAFLQLA